MDGHYLKAVKLFKQGRSTEGFRELDAAGCIHELKGQSRIDAYAEAIIESETAGVPFIAANFTHRENTAVSDAVRSRMKAVGQLTDERMVTVHSTLGWSDAQKKDVAKIKVGMVLEITRGKDKGSTLRVVAARPDYVQAMNADGQLVKFTKANFKMFDVCETRALPVAIGDKLLVRSGSGSLTNQQRITFTGWDSSGNPVADGKVIEHRNLCHAYASTARSVQGSTAARVITGFDRNSVRAATKDIPYVLNSRGREDCQIYVESIADLSQIQNRSGDRKFATKMSVETPKLVARPAQKTDSFDFSPRPDLRRASMHQARSGVDMARGLER